jgi:hypothetical protein
VIRRRPSFFGGRGRERMGKKKTILGYQKIPRSKRKPHKKKKEE